MGSVVVSVVDVAGGRAAIDLHDAVLGIVGVSGALVGELVGKFVIWAEAGFGACGVEGKSHGAGSVLPTLAQRARKDGAPTFVLEETRAERGEVWATRLRPKANGVGWG